MSMRRYVYDFGDYTSVNGPIPLHPDGRPKVHTWLWGGDWCPCEGAPEFGPPCLCQGALHMNVLDEAASVMEGEPVYIPHLLHRGHPGASGQHPRQYGRDEEIRAGAIIEADLGDGSYRSHQIIMHLQRGACHELSE